MRALVGRLGPFAALLAMVTLLGCSSRNGREQTIAHLQVMLRDRGFHAYVFDRSGGLVGPPKVPGCDPPLVGSGSGLAAYFYVCADGIRASRAQIPRSFPGRRVVRNRTLVVINGGTSFQSQVIEILAAA